jgi:hypothetical protein
MRRLILLAWFVAASAQALPEAVRSGEPGWRQWGSGEMTWFGISLYRATLWVAGAGADPGNLPENSSIALQLEYRRDIPRERLVQSSLDEMRRLGADEAQLARWASDLQRVFPDVKEGDSIVGVHHPGRGASFYHRGLASGEVADAEFARRFFAIWLDPESRSPSLRAALLKRPPG